MPESWDPDSGKASTDVRARRAAAAIPDDEHHRPKWQLALECVDEALSWGLPPPPVLAADAGYGDAAGFRHGLTERGIAYAVQISHTLSVLPATATRTTAPYSGRGPRPKPRYQHGGVSVKEHIVALGRRRAAQVTWRAGSKQQHGQPQMMSGRFVFCRVLQADAGTRSIYKGQDLPECWLIAQWPPGATEPTRYWLSTLPGGCGDGVGDEAVQLSSAGSFAGVRVWAEVSQRVAVGWSAAEVAAFDLGLGGHRGPDPDFDPVAFAFAHAAEDGRDEVVGFVVRDEGPPTSGTHSGTP